MGSVAINAMDEAGVARKITIKDCLISPTFPYKLFVAAVDKQRLSDQITMNKEKMRITSKDSPTVLVGLRDPTTQLFFLQEYPEQATQSQDETSLLARSYGADSDLLWKLHLRHGHRNSRIWLGSIQSRFPSSCLHVHLV